jgi:Ca2+-transporting ATPase
LQLLGISLLLTFLATELDFLNNIFKLTSLIINQWLLGISLAFALVLVSEIVKYFMRRRKKA